MSVDEIVHWDDLRSMHIVMFDGGKRGEMVLAHWLNG
jgi:hypothetical protein